VSEIENMNLVVPRAGRVPLELVLQRELNLPHGRRGQTDLAKAWQGKNM
jgi:hypothetical protein